MLSMEALRRFKRPAAFALLFLIGLGMAWMSWRKWCDPFIDYGHQLYVPWQIAEGRVLYRDIPYLYGPFSVYFNSVLYRLFGVHLLTLALFDHLLLAVLVWLVFRVIEETCDFAAAFACAACFLAIMAFSQYTPVDNENYITPYSHELVHAMVFTWAAILSFILYLKDRRSARLWTVGLLAGLVFTTKVEAFAAAAAALFAGFAGLFFVEQTRPREIVRPLALTAAGFAIAPLSFFLLFCRGMSPPAALESLFHQYLMIRKVNTGPFGLLYPWLMGMDKPLRNLLLILFALGWQLVLVGGLALACLAALRAGEGRRRVAGAAFWTACAAAAVFLYYRFRWVLLFRPGTLYLPLACAWFAWEVVRRRSDLSGARPWIGRLMLAIFAFVLSWKILLKINVLYYGFALAMPAILGMIALAVYGLPRILPPCGFARPAVLAFFAVCALWHVNRCRENYAFHTFRLGPPHGGDWVYDVSPRKDFREKLMQRAYEKLTELKKPGERLAAFPQAVILNYWTRMPSPTHMTDYAPTMLAFNGGEDEIVRRLDRDPPEWATFLDADCSQRRGDPGHLGQDFGFLLYDWINAHYVPVYQALPPDRSSRGILILRRKDLL